MQCIFINYDPCSYMDLICNALRLLNLAEIVLKLAQYIKKKYCKSLQLGQLSPLKKLTFVVFAFTAL